jgi:segregation and condensation protein B
MKRTPERPAESQAEGVSLDALGEAFAQALGRSESSDTDETPAEPPSAETPPEAESPPAEADDAEPSEPVDVATEQEIEDGCPVTPATILEAMLFVGDRQGQPLSAERAAEPMRGVEPDEIPDLVDQLNHGYRRRGAPYQIVSQRGGYAMILCPEFRRLRDRFHGRVREARLSQAAIDTLAIVAYRQPLSADEVGRLRGKPSSHVLSQLVRRGLLRIERREVDAESGRKRRLAFYHTTDRFLELFSLESLADLPRSEELEK